MKRLGLTVLATATVALLGWVTPVQATPITYKETWTGSGSLGASFYTNALVTLTITGDTSTVVMGPLGVFTDAGSATVDVSGLGTATTPDLFQVIDFQSPGGFAGVAGSLQIVDTSAGFVSDLINGAFLTYDLKSSIGPLSAFPCCYYNAGLVFPTSLGLFDLQSVRANGTFTATIESPAPVPEPTSLILLGTGVVTLVGRRFRRRRSTPHTSQ